MRIDYWAKFEEHSYYHIYNRDINGANISVQERNYFFCLDRWKKYLSPYFDVIAYCLMPNHFHFLVRVRPFQESMISGINADGTQRSQKFVKGMVSYNEYLEDQFKRLFSSYALAINRQEGRHGSLLEKRFKRVLVRTQFKLWYLLVSFTIILSITGSGEIISNGAIALIIPIFLTMIRCWSGMRSYISLMKQI
jgi:REP element-mobilizing transposase RayT